MIRTLLLALLLLALASHRTEGGQARVRRAARYETESVVCGYVGEVSVCLTGCAAAGIPTIPWAEVRAASEDEEGRLVCPTGRSAVVCADVGTPSCCFQLPSELFQSGQKRLQSMRI